MKNYSRRNFIKKSVNSSLGASAALNLWGTKNSWAGANDRVRIAVVGIRGMGQSHIREFSKLENVQVAALCDVDENLYAERIQKLFVDQNRPKPKTYYDIRKLLEDKSIDAISVVTPNHWHALAGIWAMQAGKHVTIEKPCCHNFYEGKKLIEASKKYDVIVQDGAEQRSNPASQSAVKFMREGGLGEVYLAKGLCYKWRDTIGKTPNEPVPKGVHYGLWLGPAPIRPFSKNRFHYNWHWNWDYGNGDIGNQGVHEVDVARWGLGVKYPTKITAMGGHFMFDDDQTTPNTLMAMFEFPNENGGDDKKKIMHFEVRHWICNNEGDLSVGFNIKDESGGYKTSNVNVIGNMFYGSKGYMQKTVSQWKTFMGKHREPGPSGSGLANHYQNFIDAIRAKNRNILNTTIEEGHYSCALIHFANISYRLGRSLNFDPKTERFINDDEANGMLKREYREPFVVPEEV